MNKKRPALLGLEQRYYKKPNSKNAHALAKAYSNMGEQVPAQVAERIQSFIEHSQNPSMDEDLEALRRSHQADPDNGQIGMRYALALQRTGEAVAGMKVQLRFQPDNEDLQDRYMFTVFEERHHQTLPLLKFIEDNGVREIWDRTWETCPRAGRPPKRKTRLHHIVDVDMFSSLTDTSRDEYQRMWMTQQGARLTSEEGSIFYVFESRDQAERYHEILSHNIHSGYSGGPNVDYRGLQVWTNQYDENGELEFIQSYETPKLAKAQALSWYWRWIALHETWGFDDWRDAYLSRDWRHGYRYKLAEEFYLPLAKMLSDYGWDWEGEISSLWIFDVTEYSKQLEEEEEADQRIIKAAEPQKNPLEPGFALVPLKRLAKVKTNFKDADFWLTRRGNKECCGCPSRKFNKEHIGIKVERTDILLPDYLYYAMQHLYNKGYWRQFECGTIALQHIKVKDVKEVTFQMPTMIETGEEGDVRGNPIPIPGKETLGYRSLVNSKCTAIVLMDPMDFIRLTAMTRNPNNFTKEQIINYMWGHIDEVMADGVYAFEHGGTPRTIEQFVEWGVDLPSINVDAKSGKVRGHEGRHRMGAAVRAGEKSHPVAIWILNDGCSSRSYSILDLPLILKHEQWDLGERFTLDTTRLFHGILEANLQAEEWGQRGKAKIENKAMNREEWTKRRRGNT